jgi:hypothetical protein
METSAPPDEFFDAEFLSELEELAHAGDALDLRGDAEFSSGLHARLAAFLASPDGSGELSEDEFAGLSSQQLSERTTAFVEMCRAGGASGASRAVENFVVFFQALIPTLGVDGATEITRVFYKLAPTLLHIAYNDFSSNADKRGEGQKALRNLERVLIEISAIRLAPLESTLIFRSIDQLTSFIGVAEYTMANDVISSQLLSIIERNKLQRALFRLMEAEVAVQRFVRDRLGYSTPRLRLPDDIPSLGNYAPIRIFNETAADGMTREFIEVQLPDLPVLSDVVINLVGEETGGHFELRLDALGSAELDVPPDTYQLGLVYDPSD